MSIKAVFFDLDDTLVVDEVVSRETFESTARRALKEHGAEEAAFVRDAMRIARELWQAGPCHPYCRRIGISAFECLWGGFEGETEDLRALKAWSRGFREQVFDGALRAQMIETEGGRELAEFFAKERRRLQRLMPDAREVLARLAPKYRLGLLTNGAPDLQREKLAASGLGDFFQAVSVSGELDIGKPLAGIFHRLAEELKVAPEEAVMVGNSLERDIAGAKNAGVLAVWIKVPGSEEQAAVEPDFTILGLAELPDLLGKLEAQPPAGAGQ